MQACLQLRKPIAEVKHNEEEATDALGREIPNYV